MSRASSPSSLGAHILLRVYKSALDGELGRFIEEPTAPDDILGHAAIRKALKPHGIGVATGEHAHNRMVFKQLLQAEAIDVVQIDSCRLAGVSEVLSVLFMAAKYAAFCAVCSKNAN
jgi:L-alanine-DL-glutamate epimerase-like enolase superfamily enzyme